MKKLQIFLSTIIMIGIFASCSTKVDIYADYKDVAIIYAMLNPRSDTNFVKITHAFCGTNDNYIDANEVALIADSSDYPGKLDARIIELRNTHGGPFEPSGRVIVLDTMTIHNKLEGAFYAPDQKVYFTKEPFYISADGYRYGYRLIVVKPNGDTLTAQTRMVGNEDFSIMSSSTIFQMAPTNALGKIIFRADGVAPVYEINMEFNYIEQHANKIKHKRVSRSFGVHPLWEYPKIENTENVYYQEYSINWLFNALANAIGTDTVVNPNHPNVVRYAGDFVYSISAAGEELYLYYAVNQAQMDSPISLISSYTNIDGGYGLFSSRTSIQKTVRLSSSTQRELYGLSSWGFKEQ